MVMFDNFLLDHSAIFSYFPTYIRENHMQTDIMTIREVAELRNNSSLLIMTETLKLHALPLHHV